MAKSANALTAFSGLPFSPAALVPKKDPSLERGYAPSLRLVSTGTSGLAMENKVRVGNFGIINSDKADDVGNDLVIVPLAKLHKAVDFSDSDEIVQAFGDTTDEYQEIAARCDRDGYDSGCMYGPLYLLFVANTGQFVELFLNSKSARFEEATLDSYLPISEEIAEQYGVDARAPQLVSLKSKLINGKKNKWYVPVVSDGPATLEGVDPPTPENLQLACKNFIKQTEKAVETEAGGRDR